MSRVLASSGDYQVFTLHSTEWGWLIFAAACGVAALVTALFLMRGVLAADEGTPSMIAIAKAIQEGALAYLKRQFKTIGIIIIPLAVLVFVTSTKVLNATGGTALGFVPSGIFRTLAFVVGATLSGLTGFIGMSTAVRGNVRTAAAARSGSLADALRVAFRTGGVTGMFVVGFGLLGATVIVMLAQNTATAILIGFGFGCSLLALFMRVGGGIFTKAADVGADLVGKVEAGIPEDDPRNAATIADNVGDNVGDCAGMAADLFESYAVILVATLLLAHSAFTSIGKNPAEGVVFSLIVPAIGILASIIGVLSVKARPKDKTAMAPINRGFLLAAVLTIVGTFLVAEFYVHDLKIFFAVVTGVVLGQVASRITEYYTSTETSPVRDIAESARTGPATTVLSGISSGLESSVPAIIAIVIAIAVSIALGNGNIEFSLYLVALSGLGLLATTGVVVSEDSFGPVSDNAAGIAEMTGEFEGEPERIMVSLDAVGNTTKAITKGFAIGSAVIAAVALFASYVQTIAGQRDVHAVGNALYTSTAQTVVNVANPKTFIGLLIGGSIAFLFSSLAIRAVGRSAGTVVQEVRRQFHDHPGIMDGTETPEYGRVIDICTAASLRELATPALLAILSPVVVGFGIGDLALGAFLAGTILTGQLMANFLSNSGGAWDNAKKYIEDGNEGGKGSEAHKAAVIGDTVGDPFKDTAGPALNPLIKVMNLVSLLILPAVITLSKSTAGDTAARYIIAAAALLVILAGVAFSKRKVQAMDRPVEESVGGGEMPTGAAPAGVAAAAEVPAGVAPGGLSSAGVTAGTSGNGGLGDGTRSPAHHELVVAIDRYIDSDGSEVIREQLLEVRSRLRET
ncbi:MAG: sodium-translocating pyrophosphatase [Actinomycetota bacterium]|nr:sodium-translocating pyrophosphatase [Actinomycetota bacterium]